MGARIGCVRGCPKFGLKGEGQRSPRRNDRTYVKDMENLVELRPPGGDRFFVVLRVVTSGDCIPFTSLDDMLLDLNRGPGREFGKEIARMASYTHVFSFSIASRTDRPSWSADLVFTPCSRVSQTLAQVSPSST